MIHETRGPKYNLQEPRGSTSDCLTLIPKETCQKYNHQEPIGSTSGRLTFVLKKITHVYTQNNIAAPLLVINKKQTSQKSVTVCTKNT